MNRAGRQKTLLGQKNEAAVTKTVDGGPRGSKNQRTKLEKRLKKGCGWVTMPWEATLHT